MTVTVAPHAGFCFGVDRAVNMALSAEGSRCTLGEIIHNRTVTDERAGKGVRIIDEP
ncbi:MAG: 4-hydroxy-3-methylbut-2-enyl diphosphate reductase, partial [Oscillospiraceae bacterium]|nr:4-hydroxy-3-methylbut-2-enyl diphosphate reductase [Oscillospiraceae bacterium]